MPGREAVGCRGLGLGWVGGGGPEEAGQFAGARDVGDVAVDAAFGEALAELVEASLAAPGDLADGGFDTVLSLAQGAAEAWRSGAVPGCFDQQPTGVAG